MQSATHRFNRACGCGERGVYFPPAWAQRRKRALWRRPKKTEARCAGCGKWRTSTQPATKIEEPAPHVDVACKCGWTGKRQSVPCAKHVGRVEPFCDGCVAPYGMCPREGLPVYPSASQPAPESPKGQGDGR